MITIRGVWPFAQRGVSLVMALTILALVSLFSLASLGTSLLELRMAGNTEVSFNAQEQAQSAIESTIKTDWKAQATRNEAQQYLQLTGSIGHTQCTPNWASGGRSCNTSTIVLSDHLDGTSDGYHQVQVTRLSDPVVTRGGCTKGAKYEISSAYDKSGLGQGKSELVQGYVGCTYLEAPYQPIPSETPHN